MPHELLSDDWIAAVEALDPEAPEPPAATKDVVRDLVVTYDVAEQLFVDQDQAASMQASVSGRIEFSGDTTQLTKLQTAGPPTAEQEAFQARIQELTSRDHRTVHVRATSSHRTSRSG